jgi:predicted ATP-grasp superfamily ATP-dependent carboligase
MESTIEKCKEVCKLIDQEIGHYGDLAIDVILDKEKHPYILEINNRIYGTKSLIKLGKRKMFKRIRTTPLAYAKALAGF